jgi:hypothetical protein
VILSRVAFMLLREISFTPIAEQIRQMFEVARRRVGLSADGPELSTTAFRRPGGAQLDLGLSTSGLPHEQTDPVIRFLGDVDNLSWRSHAG